MSVDQALLDGVGDGGPVTLRFYRWNPPALSLGYFQSIADRAEHPASQAIELVRRPTGGGALIHEHELTYCIAAPLNDRFLEVEDLVATLHQTLIDALAAWGIRASIVGDDSGSPPEREPFLCFQRRSRFDLVLATHKIAGSAQRRNRNATLVHGSVLLACSPNAAELPGIEELAGRAVPSDELAECWQHTIAQRFGWTMRAGELRESEAARADYWRQSRFLNPAWNLRR